MKVPAKIQTKILQLKEMETRLGNLPPEKWKVSELTRIANDPNLPTEKNSLQSEAERLFREICEDLEDANFSDEEIANAINEHLRYVGGPKYCNADEVSEALSG